jgi:hypothetical protein
MPSSERRAVSYSIVPPRMPWLTIVGGVSGKSSATEPVWAAHLPLVDSHRTLPRLLFAPNPFPSASRPPRSLPPAAAQGPHRPDTGERLRGRLAGRSVASPGSQSMTQTLPLMAASVRWTPHDLLKLASLDSRLLIIATADTAPPVTSVRHVTGFRKGASHSLRLENLAESHQSRTCRHLALCCRNPCDR